MRTVRNTVWAMALVMVLMRCASTPPPPPPPPIDFKGELSRVGEWIVVAPYGRLWHPNPRVVGKDFVPYFTGGTWEYTPQGWSFRSKWDWGRSRFSPRPVDVRAGSRLALVVG